MFGSSLHRFVLLEVHILLMLFVFIYVYWCSTRFPCQMMFVSINNNMTVVTSGAGTNNTSGALDFKWCSFCSVFSFPCSVLYIIVCSFVPLVLFLLSIVMSILRFTNSDYTFDVFKLQFAWPTFQKRSSTVMPLSIVIDDNYILCDYFLDCVTYF